MMDYSECLMQFKKHLILRMKDVELTFSLLISLVGPSQMYKIRAVAPWSCVVFVLNGVYQKVSG